MPIEMRWYVPTTVIIQKAFLQISKCHSKSQNGSLNGTLTCTWNEMARLHFRKENDAAKNLSLFFQKNIVTLPAVLNEGKKYG